MKTIHAVLLAMFFGLVASPVAFADDEVQLKDRLFLEIWNDNYFRKTNFEIDEPGNSEENYYISEVWMQFGLRYGLSGNFYFDPHLIFQLSADWGDEEWNDVYWNNSMYGGGGVRFSYELTPEDEESTIWISDLNIALFANLLFSTDSLDSGKNEILDTDADENFITGINLWAAIDTKSFLLDNLSGWSEVFTELVYESSGFADEEMDNYYPFIGVLLAGVSLQINHIYVQPYLSLDMTTDLGNESWNKESWLNNYTYGPGIRISLGELLPVENADLYIYFEYQQRDYFSRVDEDLYSNLADDDIRIGVEIYLPFGATSERIQRH